MGSGFPEESNDQPAGKGACGPKRTAAGQPCTSAKLPVSLSPAAVPIRPMKFTEPAAAAAVCGVRLPLKKRSVAQPDKNAPAMPPKGSTASLKTAGLMLAFRTSLRCVTPQSVKLLPEAGAQRNAAGACPGLSGARAPDGGGVCRKVSRAGVVMMCHDKTGSSSGALPSCRFTGGRTSPDIDDCARQADRGSGVRGAAASF